ncbi:MAG: sensor domain-containing protein [Phycisphaerae bacterium]|nr:sensor domain-containing protein [Phycisphaerae bacterium]
MDSAETPKNPAYDSIALYLAQLELALSGQSPALVHDAVIDAEGHLRAAVAAGATPSKAVSDFGSPDVIARAYIEADHPRRGLPRDALSPVLEPMKTDPSGGETAGDAGAAAKTGDSYAVAAAAMPPSEPLLRRARRIPVLGIWFDPYAWGSLFFFTTVGFVFAIASFSWVIGMGGLSLGTLPILIGLVFLVLLLGSVRALCMLDGLMCQFFLGVRMPRRTQPVYTTHGISIWQRLGCWLRDVRSWLSLGYLLGNFPVAIALFALFVALLSTSAALLGMPIVSLFSDATINLGNDADVNIRVLGHDLERNASGEFVLPFLLTLLLFVLGLLLATCTLWLARGLGWVYGHVVQAIQVARPRAVLVRPVERVADRPAA